MIILKIYNAFSWFLPYHVLNWMHGDQF